MVQPSESLLNFSSTSPLGLLEAGVVRDLCVGVAAFARPKQCQRGKIEFLLRFSLDQLEELSIDLFLSGSNFHSGFGLELGSGG